MDSADQPSTMGEAPSAPTGEPTPADMALWRRRFHESAWHVLTYELGRIRAADMGRFNEVVSTSQAGGFLRLSVTYSQGEWLDTGVWLHQPFCGATEIWNLADDFPLNKVRQGTTS